MEFREKEFDKDYAQRNPVWVKIDDFQKRICFLEGKVETLLTLVQHLVRGQHEKK